jgi:hypothetical protein
MSDENGIVQSGKMILIMLENFLNEGIWQYGLQRADGTILQDISSLPQCTREGAGAGWYDGSDELHPILWFGLKDESPIECWALDKSPGRFEMLEVWPTSCSKNTVYVERWHWFWFNSFLGFDWDALFNNNGNRHLVWMFWECGMEEPVDALDSVRNSCPIDLDEADTAATIIDKIDSFFLGKQDVQA